MSNDEKVHFAKAEVHRLMKENLPSDVYIQGAVKIGMNNFLYKILEDVCKKLDSYNRPLVTEEMFKETILPYQKALTINKEREYYVSKLTGMENEIKILKLDMESRMETGEVTSDDRCQEKNE